MSDYKGAALMLPALPKARELLADKGYDADWFRAARQAPFASLRNPIGRSRSPMTPSSTSSATKSKTCSDGSKIGDASTPDTTVAPFSAICIAAAVIFWL
jgi:hypothetical protein